MAKPLSPDSENQPEPRRRQSDLDGAMAGISEGGRRASDQKSYVAPKNRWATLAITCSFLFSGILMFWAFSRPYQAVFQSPSQQSSGTKANPVGLEYEASLTDEEYDAAMDSLDRNLLELVRQKNRPKRVPSKDSVLRHIDERVSEMKTQWENFREKDPEKGSAEWQAMKDLEEVAVDLDLVDRSKDNSQ